MEGGPLLEGASHVNREVLDHHLAAIPARAGFPMHSLVCEIPVSVSSALYSLQNWQHIILSPGAKL